MQQQQPLDGPSAYSPSAPHFVYIQYPSPPASKSSGEYGDVFPVRQQHQQQQQQKRRRQQTGYACDKCRERRVGCDRAKPTCSQCQGKYKCVYSNNALRIENMSMRQRMDKMYSMLQQMSNTLSELEKDYRATIPRLTTAVSSSAEEGDSGSSSSSTEISLEEWTKKRTGWNIWMTDDGRTKSIQTNIQSIDHLRTVLSEVLQQPPSMIIPRPLSIRVSNGNNGRTGWTISVFDQLDRFSSRANRLHLQQDGCQPQDDLDPGHEARLIQKHHECSFPILVSPSRFDRHYFLTAEGRSAILCHTIPHVCIYHPEELLLVRHPRALGEAFYEQARLQLGPGDEEQQSLASIHQRTILISYDLDLARVRRAYLHLGIAIRMCFALNLHCPKGYEHCRTPFEREQAKRVFWAVWFLDSMVPHFFAQPCSIALEDVRIDLPVVLSEFDQTEIDRTRFTIALIHVRRIAAEINQWRQQQQQRQQQQDKLAYFEGQLDTFYGNLAPQNRYPYAVSSNHSAASLWVRRTRYCTLLDYCECWMALYRPYLNENQAVLRTSQAAFAMLFLFQHWFRVSQESGEGFDCFFRPYLYHFMSAIQIFKHNVVHKDGALRRASRAAIVRMLELYRATPTYSSFAESKLESDLLSFMRQHGIAMTESLEDNKLEFLVNHLQGDNGWRIFLQSDNVVVQEDEDDDGERLVDLNYF